MKEEFVREIQNIENEKLRTIAMKMVDQIPEYFWHIPASSSGKYHPKCDLGEGGLVRHSLMVCTCALDLLVSGAFLEDTSENRDMARIATLFHDSFKSGKPKQDGSYSEHTEFDHPLLAADFLRVNLINGGIDETTVETIAAAVESHMGKWNTSKYSDVVLPVPNSSFEKLIHTADYIASRKYIGGLERWAE